MQEVIESAIGGMNLTTTIEGRERYPVNVRYARELRGDIEQLKKVLVPLDGAWAACAAATQGPAWDRRGSAVRRLSICCQSPVVPRAPGPACRYQGRAGADEHQERGGSSHGLCLRRFLRAGTWAAT